MVSGEAMLIAVTAVFTFYLGEQVVRGLVWFGHAVVHLLHKL